MSLFPNESRYGPGQSHTVQAHGLRVVLDAETVTASVVVRLQDDKAGEVVLTAPIGECVAGGYRIDGYDLTPSQRRWLRAFQFDAEDWESATRALHGKGGAQ